MPNDCHIRTVARLMRTCSSPSQSIVDTWDRFVQNRPFLVSDAVKNKSRDLESVDKAQTLVGIGEDVA